ncbi:MAG: nicotinate (nicotinamide) nucleotide adenylyltransferase [Verrucomicrobia bacterium]|nr:nicotinate (nicotinamide) nucleotide adenylyltransferase [Verrucomicrobiota bacterium]
MGEKLKGKAGEALRMGILGGTFDPVHRAHLAIARAARAELKLDKVVFIPTAQSPIKSAAPVANAAQRLAMLRLALAEEPDFSVDTYEMDQGGVSYSIATVELFKGRFPSAELFWILGADQFEQLGRWREIERLAEKVTFSVSGRHGASLAAPEIRGLNYVEIDTPLMDISSSEIRRAYARGMTPTEWLPPGLDAFILQEGLYKPCV